MLMSSPRSLRVIHSQGSKYLPIRPSFPSFPDRKHILYEQAATVTNVTITSFAADRRVAMNCAHYMDVDEEEVLYDRVQALNLGDLGADDQSNAATTENTQGHIEVILTKPSMPYGTWNAVSLDIVEQSTTNSTSSKLPHWIPELDAQVAPKSDLQYLMNVLDPLCAPIKSRKDEELLSDVNTMLRKTLDQLKEKRKLFAGAQLIPTGSIVENTKVGNPRELDFLVALPYLSEQQLFIPCNYFKFECFAKVKKDLVPHVLSDWDSQETFAKEKEKRVKRPFSVIEDVRVAVANVFRTHLSPNLLPNWTLMYPSDTYSDSTSFKLSLATQFSFINNNDNVNIKADICFSVPLKQTILQDALDGDDTGCYFKYLIDLSKNYTLYGIIGSIASHYTTDDYDRVVFRIAVPELEQKTFKVEDATGTRSKCYRLAKCIVTKFMPERWTPKLGCTVCECPHFMRTFNLTVQSCEMCWHPFIPSFILKTILQYMSSVYTSDFYWSDTNLGNRLLEMFLILHHCFQENENRYLIAAFHLPETVGLDNILSEQVEDPKPPFNPNFGFNFGSFLVPGNESSSYEYGKVFPNEFLPELKDSVGRYISCVRSEKWSLRELVCRMKDMMIGLKQTTTVLQPKLSEK